MITEDHTYVSILVYTEIQIGVEAFAHEGAVNSCLPLSNFQNYNSPVQGEEGSCFIVFNRCHYLSLIYTL